MYPGVLDEVAPLRRRVGAVGARERPGAGVPPHVHDEVGPPEGGVLAEGALVVALPRVDLQVRCEVASPLGAIAAVLAAERTLGEHLEHMRNRMRHRNKSD